MSATDLNDQQLLRYTRHILLNEIGIEGQEKIRRAKVVLIGAGGLGSACAVYLATAGVGELIIVDNDQVELSNLQRQILHTEQHIGKNKADSARLQLNALNSEIKITDLNLRIDANNIREILLGASVVVDCSDNFLTRHIVNEACVQAKTPLVIGAAIRFNGQLMVFDANNPQSACYACVFPQAEQNLHHTENCATYGVFAPLVGIIGSAQASETLKLITRSGDVLSNRLWLLDALNMNMQLMKTAKDDHCAVCAE